MNRVKKMRYMVMAWTSPVTGVLLLQLYSVGPPSLRNASNQPFISLTLHPSATNTNKYIQVFNDSCSIFVVIGCGSSVATECVYLALNFNDSSPFCNKQTSTLQKRVVNFDCTVTAVDLQSLGNASYQPFTSSALHPSATVNKKQNRRVRRQRCNYHSMDPQSN